MFEYGQPAEQFGFPVEFFDIIGIFLSQDKNFGSIQSEADVFL